MPVGVSAFLIEAEIDCYIFMCACVCSSQVERERKSARVRKRSFCSFFLIRAFSTEAPEQKSFDVSISRPDDDSNAKKAESLSRSDKNERQG